MLRYERLLGGKIGLAVFRQPSSAAERVIWFPFGGGSSRAFAAAAAKLPADWAVMAVDPPGHMLTDGQPVRDPTALAELIVQAVGVAAFEGAILAGQSVGGLLAAHVVRLLELRGVTFRGCIIGAARPPGTYRSAGLSSLTYEELFRWWIGNLALEATAEGARDLFRLLEPSIRADIDVFEAFDTVGIEIAKTPALVLCGTSDEVASPAMMGGWKQHLAQHSVRMIEGGHFFVMNQAAETASAMAAAPWLRAGTPFSNTPMGRLMRRPPTAQSATETEQAA